MIQQNTGQKKYLSHKNFRKRLVESLVEDRMTLCRNKKSMAGGEESYLLGANVRLNGIPHFMERREQGTGAFPCVICNAKKQIYYCKTCTVKPYLHPDSCFEIYHTVQDF